MKILTAGQMQRVDRLTTEVAGVPSLLLMENAGFNLFLALDQRFPDLHERSIAIICGKGNNGGDGMVLARQLAQRGIPADLFLLAEAGEVRGDAAVNLAILLRSGVPVFEVTSVQRWGQVAASLDVYGIIVDAILGTGTVKPLSGLYQRVVEDINRSSAFVLAVDLPSGMVADSLERAPLTVEAEVTVTFTAPKIAHALNPDQEAIGELVVAAIGTPPELLDQEDATVNLIGPEVFPTQLLSRAVSSHKGSYGHVGLVAGSRDKSGAAALSAVAALRAGSGLVTALVPEPVRPEVAAGRMELMTEGLVATAAGTLAEEAATAVLERLQRYDAAGLGPGLGTEDGVAALVRRVVLESPIPLVVDADGLNAFGSRPRLLKGRTGPPLVLTPHPGEFGRLVDLPASEVLRRQLELVPAFARESGAWVVLKTFRSLVADPQGVVYVSPRGNPGMATAGMGDVLTGVLTSLLGQLAASGVSEPDEVTRTVAFGVYLHGLAGDLAAEAMGEAALTAGDVIDFLGEAWDHLCRGTGKA